MACSTARPCFRSASDSVNSNRSASASALEMCGASISFSPQNSRNPTTSMSSWGFVSFVEGLDRVGDAVDRFVAVVAAGAGRVADALERLRVAPEVEHGDLLD